MSLKTNTKGFTIVELLIVIVVIGILAAITIVAFNGIQTRGRDSAAQSLGNSILKKAEAYNSVSGAYPTFDEFQNNRTLGTTTGTNTGPQEARLDTTSSISASDPADTNARTDVVRYARCTAATGAKVTYRAPGSTLTTLNLGTATGTAATC